MEAAKYAIGTFESGGNYKSVGPETKLGRALGKYQVMEKELPTQLKQAGLPPMTPREFLNDPEAQDKVFETVFGGLMQKHGNFNDAASVWFSGLPVSQAGNRKDVLGTTVPMYLANTNALLGKYAGGNIDTGPTYGGAAGPKRGELRMAFTGDEIDPATGEAKGNKGIFGSLGLSDRATNALISAGFAMLANRTPYFAEALGQAGLVGMGAYAQSGRQEQAASMAERKFKLDEATKNARVEDLQLRRKEAHDWHERLDAQKAQAELDKQETGKRADREAERRQAHETFISTRRPVNLKGQEEKAKRRGADPTPPGPADPATIAEGAAAKKGASADLLDDVTLKRTAAQYNLIGGQALTNMGRGAQTGAILKQVREAAAQQDEEAGITPEQRVQLQAQNLAQRAAARSLSTQEARMGAAGFEAEGAIKLARPIIDKVDASRTSFLPFNRLIVAFKNNTLNPDQRELATRLQGIVNTYAAVMSRGANVVTDTARHRGEELLDSAFDKDALNRVLDTMQSEIDMAKNSPEQMRQFLMQKYGKSAVEGGAASVPGATAPSAVGDGTGTPPVANARKAPDGKWYVSDPERPGKYLQVQ